MSDESGIIISAWTNGVALYWDHEMVDAVVDWGDVPDGEDVLDYHAEEMVIPFPKHVQCYQHHMHSLQ